MVPGIAKTIAQRSSTARGAGAARAAAGGPAHGGPAQGAPTPGAGFAFGAAAAGAGAVAVTTEGAPRRLRRASAGAAARSQGDPLAQLGGNIPLPLPVPDWSKPIIIALLLLVMWFATRSWLAARRARRLESQRATLLGDVDAMQAALVPAVPAVLGGVGVSVAYRPAEGPAAGGDFYDLFVPEPGKVAMMLGDVSGHGHEALTHAALTRYTLRAYLQAGLEPRASLALAGRVLADPLSERFATVAVGVYDVAAGSLTYALAGHPAPILHGMPAREPVTACSSPPIGWEAPTGLRQTTVALPAGATACFFSDGLIEARSAGELLGRARLREILEGLGGEASAAALLQAVRAAAELAPDDMVACLLAAPSGASAGGVEVEELEVSARTLARADVRRFLEQCGVHAKERKKAISAAGAIVEPCGGAVLRVELAGDGASVTVLEPYGSTPGPAAGARARGEPLLAALATAG